MERADRFYRVVLPGQQAAGATSVESLRPLLSHIAPGRYAIQEIRATSSFREPEVRVWGWIVKYADESVSLERAEPAP